MEISVIFRRKSEFVIPNTLFVILTCRVILVNFVILSVSEVSKNGKFSFIFVDFSPFCKRLKMTKRAQKPKNKVFKNFNVLKSASNEREREGGRSLPPKLLHFRFVRKHCSIFSVLNLQCCHTLFCLQAPFSQHLPSRICRVATHCLPVNTRHTEFAAPLCLTSPKFRAFSP